MEMSDDVDTTPATASLDDLTGTPHAEVFADRPRTVRLQLDGGESVPPHSHPGLDVLFHVLSGEFSVRIDEAEHHLSAGDLVRFSGDREVAPEAVTDGTALVVFAPQA